jgi:hypothetical protein
MPKRNTAEGIKSHIKKSIKDDFHKDISNDVLFPGIERRWKSFIAELVKNGRNETTHHEEVNPRTMLKIYKLLTDAMDAIQHRGTPEYKEKLAKIDPSLHNKLAEVVQCGAMFTLQMYEVRRGAEGIAMLEASMFQETEDDLFDFKYIRKIVSESEKNQKGGSNTKCHGVIPFIDLPGINPGKFFAGYTKLLPTKSFRGTGKNYLFPQPRVISGRFDPHKKDASLYQDNMKGEQAAFLPVIQILICPVHPPPCTYFPLDVLYAFSVQWGRTTCSRCCPASASSPAARSRPTIASGGVKHTFN